MSKTAQRKQQMYMDGLEDGMLGHSFRWRRHPYLKRYSAGYRKGLLMRRQLDQARLKLRRQQWWHHPDRWWNRALIWMAGSMQT